MSKNGVVKIVVLIVILAVASDLLWNVFTGKTKKTVPTIPTATATITQTATLTTTPTATQTPYPTFIPTLAPTQVPEPGKDWRLLYEFSGGPGVYVKANCFIEDFVDCVNQDIEIYLGGHQFNDVYLNGFGAEHKILWTVRLVPGHNQLVVPSADDIGIGNKTDIEVMESSSNGYYLSCSPDEFGGCDCTQYNDRTTIYQSPVEGGFFLTTIEFWSEYSNVFFLNDMVKEQSIAIESGTILILPKYDHQTWDITVLPFYGERPTPMPSRTPQP